MKRPLVEIRNVTKYFSSRRSIFSSKGRNVRAVHGVSLSIDKREIVGVVGESGCGKTTLGRVTMGMIPPSTGDIEFDGDMVSQMQMVFQNPYSSLDPRFNIARSIAEPLITHTNLRGSELKQRIRDLLDSVGMPGETAHRYPHEFSGGQLQRIAIARAIALNPKFIVLDEPTSALDVSVQAQVINLLQELGRDLNLSYMFISHDLGVVRHVSDRVAVMYLGKVVELSSSLNLFAGSARHPYTLALLSSVVTVARELQQKRTILTGAVPDAANPPSGCSFHPRCPVATELCRQVEPELESLSDGDFAACHHIRKY